jgi:aminoacrylate peracid reductase
VKEERRVIDPGWRLYRDATFEPAVARGGIPMFVSGLNALEDDGSLQAPADIVAQARRIYEKLGQLLMTAGATPSDVVKTVDYFTTLERYHETASIRREFFGEDFPASTGVLVAGLLGRGVVIEIEAVVMLQA